MISDLTTETLRAGLAGLNARRTAAEDAVANMETPGYIARRVSFEDQLDRATRSGRPSTARMEVSASTNEVMPNGNNVRVDEELVTLSETGLRQQLLVDAVNAKYRLMRTVIGNA